MKGIVIEKGNDYSVLLLSDGTFRNVKHCKSYEVGDVIYSNDVVSDTSFSLKRVVSMIAASIIIVFFGTGAYIWATPVQYINIDINPSVELMVNRFDRIIKVKSLNNDGEKLIENISVRAQHYESGISKVIETARSLGYFEDEGDVLISISSSDIRRNEKAQEKIKENMDNNIEILTFGTEEHKVSIEEGLSPGKSNIIEQVIETGTSLSKEELAVVPVKDLMMKIKKNKNLEGEVSQEEKTANAKTDYNVTDVEGSNLDHAEHDELENKSGNNDARNRGNLGYEKDNKSDKNGNTNNNQWDKSSQNNSNGNKKEDNEEVENTNSSKNNQSQNRNNSKTKNEKDNSCNKDTKGNNANKKNTESNNKNGKKANESNGNKNNKGINDSNDNKNSKEKQNDKDNKNKKDIKSKKDEMDQENKSSKHNNKYNNNSKGSGSNNKKKKINQGKSNTDKSSKQKKNNNDKVTPNSEKGSRGFYFNSNGIKKNNSKDFKQSTGKKNGLKEANKDNKNQVKGNNGKESSRSNKK